MEKFEWDESIPFEHRWDGIHCQWCNEEADYEFEKGVIQLCEEHFETKWMVCSVCDEEIEEELVYQNGHENGRMCKDCWDNA